MNIRVDADSVRLRLSFDEGRLLLNNGSIEEPLALPGNGAAMKVECTSSDRFDFDFNSLKWILPTSKIKSMIDGIQAGTLTKKDLEFSSKVKRSSQDVKIVFEIDFFTTKKSDHKS